MNTEVTSMAAAIDKGLAEASPAPTPAPIEDSTNETADTTNELAVAPGSDGDQGPPEETGSSVVAGSPNAGDEKAAADGKPAAVGADGKPAVDPVTGKPVVAAGAKTPEELAAEAAAAEAAKDPLTAPLPNALKPETKQRIRTLIDMTKTATGRAEKAETQLQTIVTRVRDTGSSPEQYTQALDYLKLVNSGNREDLLKALEFMEGERIALARMAGVSLPGVSMIADYPDIEAEFHAGKITRERAEELAAGRAANDFRQQNGQHQATVTAQRNAHMTAVQTAQASLNAEEKTLQASDPLYATKRPIILKIMQPLIRSGRIPPAEWLSEFRRIYKDLPAPVARAAGETPARPGAAPAGGGGNQPLRANQPAGGQVAAPKTMAEAIEQSIAAAGRN